MKPLGTAEEALCIGLSLMRAAQKYGIDTHEAVEQVLSWINKCQRYEEIVDRTENRNNQLYDRLKRKGLCVSCGRVPPQEGSVRCRQCNKRMGEYYRRWKEKKKRANEVAKCDLVRLS